MPAVRLTPDPLLLLTAGPLLRGLLFGDVAGVLEGGRLLGVQLHVAGPLGRGVGLGEDGLDRALGDARLAVDAVVRVDVQHHLVLVEALHRTDDTAVGVLAVVTGGGDDVSHESGSVLSADGPGPRTPGRDPAGG